MTANTKRRKPAAKGNAKLNLIGLAICAVVFLGSLLLNLSPSGYRAVDGPSVGGLTTKGVFRPGGYIDFTLSPGIESIQGKYAGDVEITVSDADRTTVKLWETTLSLGKDNWGSSFGGSEKERR